jgi:hypothetical protein
MARGFDAVDGPSASTPDTRPLLRAAALGVQAADRVAKGRAELPLAHPFRNDDEEVRKPGELLLLRPPSREPQIALELPGERVEHLRATVVLEVELACAAEM